MASSVYNEWSPIRTLGDMIDFLTELPARRREWWVVESHRRHHRQQRRSLKHAAGAFGVKHTSIPLGHQPIAPLYRLGMNHGRCRLSGQQPPF